MLETQSVEQKRYDIGQYINIRDRNGRIEFESQRQLAKEKREKTMKELEEKIKENAPIDETEEAKCLGLLEFDHEAYLDRMNVDK